MTEQSLGIETQPAQQLALVGTRARVTLGRNAAFIPSAEGRLFLADDNQSQGWLTSASGALEVRLARLGTGGEALVFLDGAISALIGRRPHRWCDSLRIAAVWFEHVGEWGSDRRRRHNADRV